MLPATARKQPTAPANRDWWQAGATGLSIAYHALPCETSSATAGWRQTTDAGETEVARPAPGWLGSCLALVEVLDHGRAQRVLLLCEEVVCLRDYDEMFRLMQRREPGLQSL
jgi:hypothetical protein